MRVGNNSVLKVLTVVGTRPEAIKVAPVIRALNATDIIENITCLSGQHPDMAADALDLFGLKADIALPDPQSGGDLSVGMSVLMRNLGQVIAEQKPDWVLVHGDTMTTAAAALSAFQNQVKVGHIEAGLRTGDMASPWPEEGYRRIVSPLASAHFAPTSKARDNLLFEAVDPAKIILTGNTVVDALMQMRDTLNDSPEDALTLQNWFAALICERTPVLVTAHRRENHDGGIEQIATAVKTLADRFPDHCFILPVHPNPAVSGVVRQILSGLANVCMTDPLDYKRFVYAMERSELILTDSGGIQEEAPSFGTPVLVMRDTTERPEAVEAGVAKLVGSDSANIIANASEILLSSELRTQMGSAGNPFGDGQASQRIIETLLQRDATPAQLNNQATC